MSRRTRALLLIFVVALLFGVGASTAHAQLPPYLAYGSGLPPGATVAPRVNGIECGWTTTNAAGEWVFVISAEDACQPVSGDMITFFVNGAIALETVIWESGGDPGDAGYPLAYGIGGPDGLTYAGKPTAAATATVFAVPPVGGMVSGPSGTTDLAALVAAQVFTVDSVWKLDIATQRWQSYFPGAPSFVNSLVLASSADIVFLRRGADPKATISAGPPSPDADLPSSDRKIIFLPGITSSFNCDQVNDSTEQWWELWLYLTRAAEELRLDRDDLFVFSYRTDYDCPNAAPLSRAKYAPSDTCDSIGNSGGYADRFGAWFNSLTVLHPDAEFDIIAHSMGGVIATYWAADRASTEQLAAVHSIITLDSPLQGRPAAEFWGAVTAVLDGFGLLEDQCDIGDDAFKDLSSGSSVIAAINGIDELASPLPVELPDCPLPIPFVEKERTIPLVEVTSGFSGATELRSPIIEKVRTVSNRLDFVVPLTVSCLPGARDFPVSDSGGHSSVFGNDLVRKQILKWLREPSVASATTSTGPQIAFTSTRDGNWDIYVMNVDGSNQRGVTTSSAADWYPTFSPDGTQIAFASSRDGNSEIYVMSADGSNQRRLTSDTAADLSPAWSPGGTQIAFHSNREGNTQIYVMNADGSNQRRLATNTGTDRSPAWSPDGTQIAFFSYRDGNWDIYVMNADGSNQRRLTTNTAGDLSPAWSPDGTQIAFHSNRDGNLEIYVMNADGSNQRRLTSNTAGDGTTTWSPDGTQIAFASERDGNWDIYVMNADGSNQRRLTTDGARDVSPVWSLW